MAPNFTYKNRRFKSIYYWKLIDQLILPYKSYGTDCKEPTFSILAVVSP